MTERLLQYIWQLQYFNKSQLQTTRGEPLLISAPGLFNLNQGPDFSEGKIKIGPTTLVGNIELHISTSDWQKHRHQFDKHYDNVILHVVWQDDSNPGWNSLPVLELRDKVPKILLNRYEELMNSSSFIPCERSIGKVAALVVLSWKERLVTERLIRKSKNVETSLQQNQHHWEEAFWWMLARNMGIPVNADAFEQLARTLPVSMLSRHKDQIHQLEALLLGQAGLLNHRFSDKYPRMLQKEYRFLCRKYDLKRINLPVFFLRMRPGNFPTVRLAQLAALIQNSAHLFSRIRETPDLNKVRNLLAATANDYWHYHYRFDEKGDFRRKRLGSGMIDNIIVNTVVPVMFAYGHCHGEEIFKSRAMEWLGQTPPEQNAITRGFVRLGLENTNARDSQAFIQLKKEYCDLKRCLDCSIGNAILKIGSSFQ